jgi:ankyrin repeat protein
MSFLSFYNDHNGKSNDEIMRLIRNEEWEEADFASRTDPLAICWKSKVENFYDGEITAKVLPVHIACQRQPPVSFISTMHEIHQQGFMTAESAYKRLPLHIACMSKAPNDSILMMIELSGGASKKQDRLGRLPIHYACKSPSMEVVVARLLKDYPGSASVADLQGFLPLHVACRCGLSADIIRSLVAAAPGTIERKTKKGSTPYMYAKVMKAAHKEQVLDILIRGKTDSITTDDTVDSQN